MADNTTVDSGSGGNTIRTLEDGSNIHWPTGVCAFATTVGTPDVLEIVRPAAGLPIAYNTAADGSGTEKRAIVDTDGHLQIDVLSCASHEVTNAGTFVVQENGAALTALQLIDNLVLAEDAAHASGDPGVQLLAVRKATPANLSGADGDYEPVQMSAGRLWVSSVVTSLPTTNADSATVGFSTSGTADPTRAIVLAGSDYGGNSYPVQVNSSGQVVVNVANSTGVQVVGFTAHNAPLTDSPLAIGGYASAAAPTSVSDDGDAVRAWFLRNGAQATVLTAGGALIGGDATNGLDVDVTRSALPTGASTAANQSTANTALAAIQTAVEILDNIVSGNEAQVDIVAALPAGTNNIGDVDVLSVPMSIRGPAEPVIDSYTSKSISAAANTADQELVAAPGASKQIWVYGLVGTADTGDGSVSLQDSDNTALSGVMPVLQNGGFAISPSGNFSMPWLKVATNKALEIDTVTCGFKGVLNYAIVSV